jgi:hypothetical protein
VGPRAGLDAVEKRKIPRPNFNFVGAGIAQLGIMARLGHRRAGFDSRHGQGFFSLRHRVQTVPRAHQPSIQWVLEALSPGFKRTEREADH